MRVKMKNTESGRHPGFDNGQYHCLVGHEYEVPEKLARAWVAQGIAAKVKPAKEKEVEVKKVEVKNAN